MYTHHQIEESHPERIARPGEDPSQDLTFKPRIRANPNKESGGTVQPHFFKRKEAYFERDRKLKDEIEKFLKDVSRWEGCTRMCGAGGNRKVKAETCHYVQGCG